MQQVSAPSYVYDFHGLVELRVDSRLGDAARKQIDRQAGFFRGTDKETECHFRLNIRPYSEFPGCDPSRRLQTDRGIDETTTGIDFTDAGWALRLELPEITLYVSDSIPPIGPYLQLLLLPQNVSQIHAASIERDGVVHLFPGFGGAGKTALTAMLVRDGGYNFMGDDVAWITGEGSCLAFPRPLMLFPYHREVFPEFFKEHSLSIRLSRMDSLVKRFVNRNAPFREILKTLARAAGIAGLLRRAISVPDAAAIVRPEVIFGHSSLATRGKIGSVFFLQRFGGRKVESREMVHDELVRRLQSIIHQEWWADWKPIMLVASSGGIDLKEHYHQTARIISDAVHECEARHILIPYRASAGEIASATRLLGDA